MNNEHAHGAAATLRPPAKLDYSLTGVNARHAVELGLAEADWHQWNMNYHIEHHMFPLVPYHRLPELHEVVKDDCPPPYSSLWNAWREIAPALLRQVKDPAWHVKRQLPPPKARAIDPAGRTDASPDPDGWIEVCAAADLAIEDVIRFDHGRKTFALCRDDEGELHATDGICTHGNTHLADGLVKGKIVECPKHNGRFHLALSEPLDEDAWTGPVGVIHEVVREQYLANHPNPAAVEFYLCGPPMMIKACTRMLDQLDVDPRRIAFDEF